jgi:uncharacterized spore protein YtfJ
MDTDSTRLQDALSRLNAMHDSITVKRVFGDPIERDGVTVVPVAAVRGGGGGGGGEGTGDEGSGAGGGMGFGLDARPVGVFVLKGGEVSWQPALDRTRVIVGMQMLALVGLLVMRRMLKRRR